MENLKKRKITEFNNNPKLRDFKRIRFPLANLPIDILIFIILKLHLQDIFNLSQVNHRFRNIIYNHKPLWKDLFSQQVDGEIEIPENETIDWYKEKIKICLNTRALSKIIKAKFRRCDNRTEFIKPYDEEWNDFEMVENLSLFSCYDYRKLTCLPPMNNLKELRCRDNKLTFLPPLPSLTMLDCSKNRLTKLPDMPNLIKLWCSYNKLISLPYFPKLEELVCCGNQLTSLPSYPNLQELDCRNNQLTSLPFLPKLFWCKCDGNPLPIPELQKWKNKY